MYSWIELCCRGSWSRRHGRRSPSLRHIWSTDCYKLTSSKTSPNTIETKTNWRRSYFPCDILPKWYNENSLDENFREFRRSLPILSRRCLLRRHLEFWQGHLLQQNRSRAIRNGSITPQVHSTHNARYAPQYTTVNLRPCGADNPKIPNDKAISRYLHACRNPS